MIKLFTQNDLIKFLYHETSAEETKEISKALMCDSELQAMYNELKSVVGELDRDQMEPPSSSILNILAYSKSLEQRATSK
jgi:hypothetical protein